jgi:prepilin-type N-terminal cleavage/methylation domain-containing protein
VKRKRHDRGGERGFTIVEILVAMTVTGLGVLGFGGLLQVIGKVEAEDTWSTKALFCAQERMEELKFRVATGNSTTTEGEEVVADGAYQGMRRVWAVGHSSVFDGLLEIRAECEYPWEVATRTIDLATLVFPED